MNHKFIGKFRIHGQGAYSQWSLQKIFGELIDTWPCHFTFHIANDKGADQAGLCLCCSQSRKVRVSRVYAHTRGGGGGGRVTTYI